MQTKHLPLADLAKDPKALHVTTILVVSENQLKGATLAQSLPPVLQDRIASALDRLSEPLKAGATLCVPGWTKEEKDLWIAALPEKREAFFLLEFARDTLKKALTATAPSLRLVFLEEKDLEAAADAFGAATAARIFLMPVYGKRQKDQKPWKLKETQIAGDPRAVSAFEYGFATGEGTNLARYLATLPPNILDPKEYGKQIRDLCKREKIEVRFYSKVELKRMGAGAFTAVDQGNPDSAGGIYELTYAPRKGGAKGGGAKNGKTIHLAGKGMCFDTGGYDVKTGGNMLTMKGDMQGSAVALATMLTAARLKLPYRMKAFLAVTENHLSPKAYKPDEVITALNGITIEVVNTDAEGRMVLADTLTLASRGKPDCLIDFATLTGSAVRSIGTKYSAGFTNRDELHEAIRAAGRNSGERIWTFPIDSVFAKALESKVADTLQCTKGGPDHILASCFLSKFVEEGTPWVHIDLSAAENEGGIGHVDSLFTGFGVRWALEFIKGV